MSRRSNEEEKILNEDLRLMRVCTETLCRQNEFLIFMHRVLLDLGALENNGMGPSTFTSNALNTAYEAGKQDTLRTLVAMVASVEPNFFLNILKENINASARRAGRIAHLPDPGRDGDDDGSE